MARPINGKAGFDPSKLAHIKALVAEYVADPRRCNRCGADKAGNSLATLCRPCASRMRLKQKHLRSCRRAAGLCYGCGGAPSPGYMSCDKCRQARNKRGKSNQKRYAAERRGIGVCVVCGREDVRRYRACRSCRHRRAKQARERYARKRRNAKGNPKGEANSRVHANAS